jgi:hypothetical protein
MRVSVYMIWFQLESADAHNCYYNLGQNKLYVRVDEYETFIMP